MTLKLGCLESEKGLSVKFEIGLSSMEGRVSTLCQVLGPAHRTTLKTSQGGG